MPLTNLVPPVGDNIFCTVATQLKSNLPPKENLWNLTLRPRHSDAKTQQDACVIFLTPR